MYIYIYIRTIPPSLSTSLSRSIPIHMILLCLLLPLSSSRGEGQIVSTICAKWPQLREWCAAHATWSGEHSCERGRWSIRAPLNPYGGWLVFKQLFTLERFAMFFWSVANSNRCGDRLHLDCSRSRFRFRSSSSPVDSNRNELLSHWRRQ